jgi:ligand-binding SRPBCC domain-containing protein
MHRAFAWGAPEYTLLRTQWVPHAAAQVFPFFEDPQNLPRITPAWLDFSIVGMEPATIRAGTKIDYTLRWFGIKYRWRTLIERWEPGVSFVDTQLRGPYILWHHTHHFESSGSGTLMTDRVRYRLPFGPFGMLAHTLLVRRQLETIFDYRMKQVADLFSDGAIHTTAPRAFVE